MNITFTKASTAHENLIMSWLKEPHMMEFWDNTPEHRDDILNFIHGRPQTYFHGTTQYWIGLAENTPFAFILSDRIEIEQTTPQSLHRAHLSPTGHTIALDFGIGSKEHLGKGLAAPTLIAFRDFYRSAIDPLADTFFIDPSPTNPRARHVYEKAGFTPVGQFQAQGGAFHGDDSLLMTKRF